MWLLMNFFSIFEKKQNFMKQNRTSDYVDYYEAMKTASLLSKNPKTKLLSDYIIIAVNTGLRCSDVLKLTWEELRNPKVELEEKKTKKYKKFSINEEIHKIIKPEYKGSPFLTNRGTVITIQYLNRELKKIFANEIKAGLNISSHTFRKSFGRKIFENHNESDYILIKLSKIFNHSDVAQTRTYLGITQEEIDDIYLTINKRK